MKPAEHMTVGDIAPGSRPWWAPASLASLLQTFRRADAAIDSAPRPDRTALALSVGFVLLSFLLYGQGGQDDTYITYWPARVLAEHGQILNYNGVRLEQSSSLSLVVLLALLYKLLPFSMPTVGFLTSTGLGAVTLLLADRVAKRLRIEPSGGVLAVIATVSCFGSWATSGMETTLVTASGLLMTLQVDSLRSARTWIARWVLPTSAVLLFAASRPEAPIIVAGVVAASLAALLSARSSHDSLAVRLALSARVVAVAVVAVGLLLAFRRLYFHAWMPNPAAMKLPGFDAVGGLEYLWNCFGLNGFALAALALVGVGGLAAELFLRRPEAPTHLLAMIGAVMAGHLGFVVISGGDWMSGCRFLAPAIPTLVILGMAAWARWAPGRRQGWAIAVLLSASNLFSSVQTVHAGTNDGRPGFLLPRALSAFHRRVGSGDFAPVELANKIHERDAVTLSQFLPIVDRAIAALHRPVWVVTGQAGMMPYYLASRHYGEAKVIDLWSLTTRELYDCMPRGSAPGSRWGTLIRPEKYLGAAPSLEATCGLPQADIFYNECLGLADREALTAHGYRVIYDQGGDVKDLENNRAFGGAVRACGYFALRQELADSLGLRSETDWAWNANPR